MAPFPGSEAFASLTDLEREALLYAMQPRSARGAINKATGRTKQQRYRAKVRARKALAA